MKRYLTVDYHYTNAMRDDYTLSMMATVKKERKKKKGKRRRKKKKPRSKIG